MLSEILLLVYLFTIFITYAFCKVSDEADEALEEMRLRNTSNELKNSALQNNELQNDELQNNEYIAENLV